MKPKWLRFRFSLRTLLLAVLVIAGFATLGWNFGPWAPARRFELSGPRYRASFDPSGRWITAEARWDDSTHRASQMFVFDPDTGAQKLAINEQNVYQFSHFSFSPGGAYALFNIQKKDVGVYCQKLWHVDSGAAIDLPRLLQSKELPNYLSFSADDRMLFAAGETESIIVAMPEQTVKLRIPWKGDYHTNRSLTSDGRWLIRAAADSVSVYSVETGKLDHTWNPPAHAQKVFYESPHSTRFAFITADESQLRRTVICDALSGNVLGSFNGTTEEDWTSWFIDERHYDQNGRLYQVEPEMKQFAVALPVDRQAIADIDGNLLRFYSRVEWPPGGCFPKYSDPTTLDLLTGKILWQSSGSHHFTENPEFAMKNSEIVSTRTGAKLFTFSTMRWKPELLDDAGYSMFAKRGSEFLTSSFTESHDSAFLKSFGSETEGASRITLWRPTRPLEWYGIAWLPEFWAAALLACALLWSVWRDRRIA